jgi:ribosomal protein S17
MIKFILILILVSLAVNSYALETYEIEHNIDDEVFVINDEKFEAKTYCFNMNEGDEVIFIEGNPNGTCVSAEIYDVTSGKKCEVWCE